MDTDDLPAHTDWCKSMLELAKLHMGEKPQNRKSRDTAYADFMREHRYEGIPSKSDVFNTSFLVPAYPPCDLSNSDLSQITISELRLETHHRGKFILLRCLAPPKRLKSILALMEDEKGDAALLDLHHQEEENVREATNILNVGSIVLVKEPYFRSLGDDCYTIRVDHLCDMIFATKNDTFIPLIWQPQCTENQRPASFWRESGNVAMREERYWDAIEDYSNGLRQCNSAEETDPIRRNRALAYLLTEQFDATLRDVGYPDVDKASPEKAQFRAAEALYRLGRFDECYHIAKLLHEGDYSNKVGYLRFYYHVLSRLLEEKDGMYDFEEMQAQATQRHRPILDCATYIGPLEIKETEKKGYGLFTTKAVKAGEVLLCEKAICYSKAKTGDSEDEISYIPESGQYFDSAQIKTHKSLLMKLFRTPSLAPSVTTLRSGPHRAAEPRMVDSQLVIDTFLIQKIMIFCAFGSHPTSLEAYNKLKANDKTIDTFRACGLWRFASYFNHSCYCNAKHSFIGDMLMVRAACDLDTDTEVTISYTNTIKLEKDKLENYFSKWQFTCECPLCLETLNADDSVTALRTRLRQQISKAFEPNVPRALRIQLVERCLQELHKTYSVPAEQVPRKLVWDFHGILAEVFLRDLNLTKALEHADKSLTALGFVIAGADSTSCRFEISKWGLPAEGTVRTLVLMWKAFVILKVFDDADQALMYARTAYTIVVGEDTSFSVDDEWASIENM